MFFILHVIVGFGLLWLADVQLGVRPGWIAVVFGVVAFVSQLAYMYAFNRWANHALSDDGLDATVAKMEAREVEGNDEQPTDWQQWRRHRRVTREAFSPPLFVTALSIMAGCFMYASVGGVLMAVGCLRSS
jgi:hypothetical protein